MKKSILSDVIWTLSVPFAAFFIYYLLSIYFWSSQLSGLSGLGKNNKAVAYVPYSISDIYSHDILKNANFEFDLMYSFFGGQPVFLEPSILIGDISDEDLSVIRQNVKERGCPYGWNSHEQILYNTFYIAYLLLFCVYLILFYLGHDDYHQRNILIFTPLLFIIYGVISYMYLNTYNTSTVYHVLFCSLLAMTNGILTCTLYILYSRFVKRFESTGYQPQIENESCLQGQQ